MTLLLAHLLNGDRLSHVNLLGLILCISGMLLHARTRGSPQYVRPVGTTGNGAGGEVHEGAADTRRLLADYT